jgi:F0F1-type ATP synthase assembly protein I
MTLDEKMGTAPWLLLAGIVLGGAAAFLNLYRVVAWYQRQGNARGAGSDGGPDRETRRSK